MNKTELTKKGKEELENKLKNLIEIEKPKAEEALNYARSQGDLSENADYDAARNEFERIKGEIAQIQDTLAHCVIVKEEEEGNEKTCRLGGGMITVKNLSTNTEYQFVIVGSAEADPVEKKISNTCPVAQAIIGKKVGDIVEVPVKNPYKMEIINID